MYVDNPGQSVNAGDFSVTDSQAGVSGGVFYLNQAVLVNINKVTTGSTFSKFLAPSFGSFLYSVATTLNL